MTEPTVDERHTAARTIVVFIVPVYLVMILVIILGVWFNNQRLEDACRDRNQTKAAIIGTINAAIETSDQPSQDLTKLPSFGNLPPEVQQFVREISGPGQSNSAVKDSLSAYKATLIFEDC